MIFLNKVKKKYKNKLIFDDVNFKIDKPGLYLIIGKNGEGKSTLINIIGGFIKFKGKVKNYYKNNLRCLFQRHYLIEYLTIKENLELFNIDINILKEFDLFDKKDVYPNTLSSGQIQKISFVISMFSNGDLILLDEPLNNLDEINSNKIKEEIILHKKNKIIFVVTHRYKEFLKYANGIIKR